MDLKSPWEFEDPSCASIGVELFYRDPDSMESNSINEQKKVIGICQSCPCLKECADWGIYKERWGIWGGLTPKDREKLRRRMRRFGTIKGGSTLLP